MIIHGMTAFENSSALKRVSECVPARMGALKRVSECVPARMGALKRVSECVPVRMGALCFDTGTKLYLLTLPITTHILRVEPIVL